MKSLNEIVAEAKIKATPAFCERASACVAMSTQSKVRVPILGGMKAGKSTMLSKLLSCESTYLPPGVLEATARNVFVTWSFVANRKIEHADGSEMLVSDDAEWDGLVRGTSGVVHEGDRLVIELPSDALSKGEVEFVDTPGNNTIDGGKEVETWSALADAPLAVYCIRATSMLTNSDVAFLRTASHKLKHFVVVITRVDEAGISDVASPEALSLIEYVRDRINSALGQMPMCVLATSSRIEGEASGIDKLKDFILHTATVAGRQLHEDRARMDISALALGSIPEVQNAITLLDKSGDADAEETQRKLGDLHGRLADVENDKANALRRLRVELDGRCVTVCGEVADAARNAFARVKSRVAEINSAKELDECSQGILLSECEQLHHDVQKILDRERSSGDAILTSSAEEFLHSLSDTVKTSSNLDFKVVLSDPERYEVPEALLEESRKMSEDAAAISREIEGLQGEIEQDSSALPELRQNLEKIRQEAESLVYEPKYIENPEHGEPGRAERLLGGIGEALDWLLLLTPIPGNKLKWLGKLKYGNKISKVLKQTSKIVKSKNKMLDNVKGTIPLLGPIIDAFSVESWFRKAGRFLDGPNDSPEMIEDPETRREYEMTLAAYKEESRNVESQLLGAESTLKTKEMQLEQMKHQGGELDAMRSSLEQDIKSRAHELSLLRADAELTEGRMQLVRKAASMFSSSSEFVKPVIDGVKQEMMDAYGRLASELETRMNATISSLENQLAEFKKFRNIGVADRKEKMAVLTTRLEFYRSLIVG